MAVPAGKILWLRMFYGRPTKITTTYCTPAFDQRAADNLRFLDGLRGLAALYVVIGHARWLLWEGYSEGYLKHPDSYSPAGKVLVYFFSAFRYGHEAVLFFFVLSGFVIHLRYAQRLKLERAEAEFDWLFFIGRRARRLYPPLFASLVLTFLLDSWGRLLEFSIYSQTTPYALINQNIPAHLDLITLAGNLVFLMETYVPVYGSNGPLWSLKFEWWFYMLYPLFWWLSKRSVTFSTAIMVGLFVASFRPEWWPVALFRDVFSAMLIWWLGVLLADTIVGRLAGSMKRTIVLTLSLAISSIVVGGKEVNDLTVGLCFAGFLAMFLELSRRGVQLHLFEILKPLGDISYTLYVIHFPLLIFMSGWLMEQGEGNALPTHFGWVTVGTIGTVVCAFGLHFLVERPYSSRMIGQHKNITHER